jgi:hypothetical protein
MIFVRYRCVPTKRNPRVDAVGEAAVACWVRVRSFREAQTISRLALRREHWSIHSIEEIRRTRRADYKPRGEGRKYFDQAVLDRDVYAIHSSPKHPVCQVDFVAIPARGNRSYPRDTRAKVVYLVVNERVSRSADYFDDFWLKPVHLQKAIALGRRRIRAAQWQVVTVESCTPLGYRAVEKYPLFARYYDEAEENGDSIAFWPDHDPL